MTRHAKNAAAFSVFSHAERKRLTYGTQSRRGGLDAQRVFDACELCLTTAEQPVTCQAGHVFCKGCIFEWMAQQKEAHKLLLAKYEAQQSAAATAAHQTEAKEQEAQARKFQQVDESVVKGMEHSAAASSSSRASSGAAPAGYVRVQTTSGGGFVVDRELVSKLAEGSATAQQEKKAFLPCFWLPSMAPSDVGEAKLTEPPPSAAHHQCRCPGGGADGTTTGGGHPLKLKHLKPIKWHFDRTGTAKQDQPQQHDMEGRTPAGREPTVGRPQCFSCKKALTNQTPMACIRSCGHVACRICIDALMLNKKKASATANTTTTNNTPAAAAASSTAAASASSSSSPPPSLICLECDRPCKQDDIVPIVASTGYAATGATVAKAKLTPAFRC